MSKAPTLATVVKRHGSLRSKDILYGQQTLTLYTIGWLAELTGMALSTLRLWERQGILPRPLLHVGHAGRYYTAVELQEYRSVLRQLQSVREAHKAESKKQLFWAVRARHLKVVQQCTRLKQPLPQPYVGLTAVVSLTQNLMLETEYDHEGTTTEE